jgi:hypothetical protein
VLVYISSIKYQELSVYPTDTGIAVGDRSFSGLSLNYGSFRLIESNLTSVA